MNLESSDHRCLIKYSLHLVEPCVHSSKKG